MHGLLTASPRWEVTGRTADEVGARLRARFAFDDASGLTAMFPFPHTLAIEAELRGAELEVRAIVRADAGSPVPVAFGFHPYMRLPGLPRAEWEVSAPVANRLLLDERGLPTGERGPADFEPGPLGERGLDDAFTSSGGDPFALSGGGRRIEVALVDGYPYVQLYAPPDRDLIAFEPMTAPTNALVSGEDLTVLEPGEEYEACYKVIPIGF
jgi:galactose mutarotase-like enzyme